MLFQTQDGIVVPAVTAEQMREVDRIGEDYWVQLAVEEGAE